MPTPPRPAFPNAAWSRPLGSQRAPLAVGAHAVVVCPNAPLRRVPLTEANGTGCVGTVADGTEVEIVAWHARGQTGWRYQVQSSDGTMEGWLSAAHLRRAPGVSG